MPIETWLIFILGFMLIGSIVALEIKDLLSAIIAIGVVGLGLSMAFLLLQAPDLAIVQFLFEIFSVVIMVRAFMRREYHHDDPIPGRIGKMVLVIVALAAVFIFSINVFKVLPPFGEPLMTTAQYYLQNGARETGSANIVTSIVLDYRGYDTLGEVTVLFGAVLGALTILRTKSTATKDREDKQ
ncbi:MAG: hydrogen gas-evolving membrane-bound hydrogenase subunit E [Candidatus Neomarinimicrobiota bacterium]